MVQVFENRGGMKKNVSKTKHRLKKNIKIYTAMMGFEPTPRREDRIGISAFDHSATQPIWNTVAVIRFIKYIYVSKFF